ncbi:DMSO/TMAO reductase YedYZ molybdopterin-dependent catalytic subunit [Rhizomicrobium palustre]|uniref:DMSO/TMAO reductase YedYZ molybdopterin-dependent catalytic subunit n=1 Tax=Rhizomicrobium palustre TaxID=189966 RepID=A0A846MYI9_9PROT|nr:molybdopterin-dependent oxidoreductase [Rhizomicrobium palustre]NIK88486.1 DMSO/TMAO reductase YedYZ molybdopterin-dependent catalytic subunit [Rhizomicrobium palustre]
MAEERNDGRRKFLTRAGASLGLLGVGLAGCSRLSEKRWVSDLLHEVEHLTRRAQRLFAGGHALAPEFSKADIAPVFRANGTLRPEGENYSSHAANGFKNWKIPVMGLVERPLLLTLDALKAFPARTQITRHDCVEGWSCIGQWKGTPLASVLAAAKPKAAARYVVFYCADNMAGPEEVPQLYYESLDLLEATHPQTILAYELNERPLPIANGAPVRLRAERQLGYKMAKYINKIELVSALDGIGGGRGGYWEDQGYSWYAGI